MQTLKLFVTGHKGFETPLFHEIREILADLDVVPTKVYGGVEIEAGLEAVYAICLHSRLANRLFCELARKRVVDEEQLYAAVAEIDWSEQLRATDSLAVDVTLSRSRLSHSHYAALKTKDAIVDQFRAATGSRPRVETRRPDLRIHVHVHRDQARISLDLAGESLHRRGYRLQQGEAPLREHLAAALLFHAGWWGSEARRGRLLDPMCGSGTFAIEAALIASGRAPGLTREYFGFTRWRRHDAALWQSLRERARAEVLDQSTARIFASDADAAVLAIARANAARAGVEDLIEFEHRRLEDIETLPGDGDILVITNPPWGQRLQAEGDLPGLYTDLGDCLRRLAPARLALFSANPEILHRLALHRLSRKAVRNGPMDCVFACFATDAATGRESSSAASPTPVAAAEAQPLINRLRKNARHFGRWARRNGISCYRVYDADLPEFAFALDIYCSALDPDQTWLHLQEYQAPPSVDAALAAQRLELACEAVRQVFEVGVHRLQVKTRRRQRGRAQYEPQDHQREFLPVREGDAELLINLTDYLDTGLFLDHRPLRARLFREAKGLRMLNLFCYTASAGVQAALGGARSVVNVDLSASYLRWARENFARNGLEDEARYRFIRADAVELLHNPGSFGLHEAFDLIFLDPPSFSNSTAMAQSFDVARDHVALIEGAMGLLDTDGLMLFSTNRRGFRLDPGLAQRFAISDISRSTIDEDFRRHPGIHRCWEIRHVG